MKILKRFFCVISDYRSNTKCRATFKPLIHRLFFYSDCLAPITLPASVCKEPDGFYPHPTDCNKFYKCVKYLPILSECIGNEHFSPINEICQDPCDALCDLNLGKNFL